MAAPDYSGVTADISKGYDYQRQKAAQTEGANLQGQKDALARRAAALGNAPGGAFVQAEQQAGNESAQRLQGANEGIDQAQNQELRGVKMTQLGQQFQSSEREAGQQFQAGQQQSAQAFQGSLQDKQLAAQKLMQETGISAQEAMQKAGFTEQEQLQSNQQNWQKTNVVDPANLQTQFENKANTNTNAFNAIQSLVAANYNGADIKKIIQNAFPGFDISQLGDISRITANGPGQGGTPAGVAPRPVAAPYTPPPQDRTAAGYDS